MPLQTVPRRRSLPGLSSFAFVRLADLLTAVIRPATASVGSYPLAEGCSRSFVKSWRHGTAPDARGGAQLVDVLYEK
eukprot:768692-Hanusia_phi.AAC.3